MTEFIDINDNNYHFAICYPKSVNNNFGIWICKNVLKLSILEEEDFFIKDMISSFETVLYVEVEIDQFVKWKNKNVSEDLKEFVGKFVKDNLSPETIWKHYDVLLDRLLLKM